MNRTVRTLAAALATCVLLAGCSGGGTTSSPEPGNAGGDAEGALVIYSGRSETLVAPVLEQLEAAVGRDVEVQYAGTAELAAKLMEEGDRSPADVFFSQDAGALGALKKADMLATLEDATVAGVEQAYVDGDKKWVATSGRARVVVYNTETAAAGADLKSVDDLLKPEFKGQIGYAPTNASFQSFVTALRVAKGEEGAKKWLEDFKALEPRSYANNNAALEAVDRGEVGLGLINHYYWYRFAEGKDPAEVKSKLTYFPASDPAGLINVAGAGVLASSERQETAQKAVAFLVSPEAQEYFAKDTAEYPVRADVQPAFDLAPLDLSAASNIDLNDLDSLDQTQAMLQDVGMI
ncbi:iron ABC transporter substrate-binding protein [Granulicoccus sp. GXG6511]|uniref:iron ABC transporter substrate-binding protein n=1 Tax=Granulicoccus sp. GXG6511 TaxID=3381351 RepID=UPI003D7CBD27